jgi:hypothetical protein
VEDFYKQQNLKLLKLKEKFFSNMSSTEFKIIAITLPNKENINTWHLIDFDYIERFKDKQPILQFGSLKINADKYPAYTKLIYNEEKNKRYLITPDKEKELKKKNFNIEDYILLAERKRLANFGEIWNIEDDRLNHLYREQLISIKIGDVFFNSTDYRKEIFLIQNKLNNKKFLTNYKGQVVMKKS